MRFGLPFGFRIIGLAAEQMGFRLAAAESARGIPVVLRNNLRHSGHLKTSRARRLKAAVFIFRVSQAAPSW